MSFRPGGVLGEGEADYQFHKRTHFLCDAPFCSATTQVVESDVARNVDSNFGLTEEEAVRQAQAQGWLIRIDQAFCPDHREEAERLLELEIESSPYEEDLAPLAPPLPRPQISREGSLATWLVALIGVLGLAVVAEAMLCLRFESQAHSDELSLAMHNQMAFEHNGEVQRLDCTSMFENPIHCSGRMLTEGQPSVPVRYTCDQDSCRIDK